MGDTITIIKTIHDTIRVANADTLETLTKVDNFYSSAWDKLVAIGTIIGIIIPIIYALYQRRLYSLNKKELTDEINTELESIKSELDNLVNKKIEEKFALHISELNKKMSALDASTFHIQGRDNVLRKAYEDAYIDFVTASNGYLKGEDYLNLGITLKVICDHVLPHMNAKQVEQLKTTKVADIDDLIKKLEKADEKGIFTTQIRLLLKSINELNERAKQTEPSKPLDLPPTNVGLP